MKILLDTCDFLWLVSNDPALPEKTRSAVKDLENGVYLSVVSFWEVLVKNARGKLPLPEAPALFVPRQRELHGISSLALTEADVKRLASLPSIHRDPFDRMLICQALNNGMHLASADKLIRQYPVPIL